jgi:hypothetical protein
MAVMATTMTTDMWVSTCFSLPSAVCERFVVEVVLVVVVVDVELDVLVVVVVVVFDVVVVVVVVVVFVVVVVVVFVVIDVVVVVVVSFSALMVPSRDASRVQIYVARPAAPDCFKVSVFATTQSVVPPLLQVIALQEFPILLHTRCADEKEYLGI